MRRRFFFKNFLYIFLPVMLAILVIGSVAIHLTISQTTQNILETNRHTIERIEESTELIFAEADAQSLNYSVSPGMIMRLEDLLKQGYNTEETRQTTNMLKTVIDSNVNSKEFLHSIYIYIDNDQKNFFASMKGLVNASNMGDTEWMGKLDNAPEHGAQWLEARTIVRFTGLTQYTSEVISMYKWLYSSGRAGKVGALVMNIHKSYLEKLYSKNLSYPGQMILLTDDNGNILCSAGALAQMMSGKDWEQAYYIQRRANNAIGIVYHSFIPRDVLYSQSREMMIVVVASILLSLVVCSTLALLITRSNTRNINGIVDLLTSAEKGEPLPELINNSDIYGYITQNIVKTYLARKQLDQQLLEKKLKLEAMHFSFLQSQLNPHFLFNTLKNIYWKTVRFTGEPNEASQMIELLTSVLHYTLVQPKRYVSLAEEIGNIRKYIRIQQMRFDNSFIDVWQVDDDLLKEPCVKFLLQPLIENCISHGLVGRCDGVITICIERQGERIRFLVEDNGVGFTPQRLEEIWHLLGQENSPGEHIGLFNVNKRLILAYDEAAALQIESVYGEGTKFLFTIPADRRLALSE